LLFFPFFPYPLPSFFFFFNDTATTELYTLSLHDALPIWASFVDTYPSDACLPRLSFTGVSEDLIRDAISPALMAPSPSVAPIVKRNCTNAGSLRNSASPTALEDGDCLAELVL